MSKTHLYENQLEWTGNKGVGTKTYKSYDRNYTLTSSGKSQTIKGSADPTFLGDATKYNPEELLVASISSCHMLWYLHLCAQNNITVTHYTDEAKGEMEENKSGSGKFKKVTLFPIITIQETESIELAESLHEKAHEMCFIANSCNFPIHCSSTIKIHSSQE